MRLSVQQELEIVFFYCAYLSVVLYLRVLCHECGNSPVKTLAEWLGAGCVGALQTAGKGSCKVLIVGTIHVQAELFSAWLITLVMN